ncbi:MAG: HEAT repeat domain-containing protein [Anaerolineales bacterium]|nr:HEAT repeat domain-containing protein [Anaerolineales bacterium]
MRFLDNIHLDRLSFWLGFLTSLLLWWLTGRLRKTLSQIKEHNARLSQQTRGGARAQVELPVRNDALQRAQAMHLASPLFPLDAILVPPRLLAPPPENPGSTSLHEDIASQTIPFLPEWPELAAAYHAPTLSLEEALSKGANLVITGAPGSGKSVALADLASRLARRETRLISFLPLLMHAVDLTLPSESDADRLAPLIACLVSPSTTPRNQARQSRLIAEALSAGRALLLLDGLDELPRRAFDAIVTYLISLLEAHPGARIITTASPGYLGGLLQAGFIPIPLSAWDQTQANLLLDRWQHAWREYLAETSISSQVDLELAKAWLLRDQRFPTPLAFTLTTWAAFAGDVLGPGAGPAIEAHLRRTLPDLEKERAAIEQLALAMLDGELTPLDKDAPALDEAIERFIERNRLEGTAGEAEAGASQAGPLPRLAKTSHAIQPLLDHGLLRAHPEGKTTFLHPTFCAYLAGSFLAKLAPWLDPTKLAAWENGCCWSTKSEALKFWACQDAGALFPDSWVRTSQPPLYEEIFLLARWLPELRVQPGWQNNVLRRLVGLIQDRRQPYALAARAIVAIARANLPGTNLLFKQIVQEADPRRKALGLLCAGMLSSGPESELLSAAINDSTPLIYQSACLALVAVGSEETIDLVGYALLHGSEEVRRAAAETLANDVEDGHAILKEAVELEDILVRRAVIYALLRVRQPWAIEILRRLQLHDPQWVVKNAADQALEALGIPNPRIPGPPTPLSETPWLIAFAGERGMGIAPGKSAREMLTLALQEGKEEQRLAALECVRQTGELYAWDMVRRLLENGRGEVQDAAFETFWRLARCEGAARLQAAA